MDAVKAFNNELTGLYEVKPPISKAKMTSITRTAIKAIKLYKHVVQIVEKFILKCKPEYKVPGLYVIDSIVRQSRQQFGPDKDVFAPRFAKNMQNTFSNLFSCPPEEKGKIIRVLNLWQNNHVFTPNVIQPLFDQLADPNNPIHRDPAPPSSNGVAPLPDRTPTQRMPGTPQGKSTSIGDGSIPSWMKLSSQYEEVNKTAMEMKNIAPQKIAPNVVDTMHHLQQIQQAIPGQTTAKQDSLFDKTVLDEDEENPSPRHQNPSDILSSRRGASPSSSQEAPEPTVEERDMISEEKTSHDPTSESQVKENIVSEEKFVEVIDQNETPSESHPAVNELPSDFVIVQEANVPVNEEQGKEDSHTKWQMRSASRDSSEERAKEAALKSRSGARIWTTGSGTLEDSLDSTAQRDAVQTGSIVRKRRRGSSTSQKPSVSISTDTLKKVIPEVTPIAMSHVHLSPNEDEMDESENRSHSRRTSQSDDSKMKSLSERRRAMNNSSRNSKNVPSDEIEKDYEEEAVDSCGEDMAKKAKVKPLKSKEEIEEELTMKNTVAMLMKEGHNHDVITELLEEKVVDDLPERFNFLFPIIKEANVLALHGKNLDKEKIKEKKKKKKETKTKYNNKISRVQCPLCKLGYRGKSEMFRHCRVIHQTSIIPCHWCNMYFTIEKEFDDHNMKVHQDAVNCAFCGKLYVSLLRLRRHMQYSHAITEQYKCRYCAKVLNSWKKRTSHEKLMHRHLFTYHCKSCSYITMYLYNLKDHVCRNVFK